MLVAYAALSNWRRQLDNETADKCLADAKLYEGAFNRYLALRPNEEIGWGAKVAAYNDVWSSLRNLTASYEVARRYHEALKSTDIDAECVKQIRKVPLVKTSDPDDRGTARATGSIMTKLKEDLGEPSRFIGLRGRVGARPDDRRAAMTKKVVAGCVLAALIFMGLLAYAQKHDKFCRNGHLLGTHQPCGSMDTEE
jgi:hypothetical protein